LYFFPANEELTIGKVMNFNLPTCAVSVKVHSLRQVDIAGKKYEAYLLVGTGGKRFNLWIDKETKYPLRIEFLFPLGKVSIVEKLN
jgi:hypothetical protein